MKYPPCKVCRHSKAKHGMVEQSTYVGWHKRRGKKLSPHCYACWNLLVYGPTYDWEYDIDTEKVNNYHEYEADNLRFLEHKSRRYEKTHKERHEQQDVPVIPCSNTK
ncbi:MAG: hypothetical protein ACREBR_04885 [bacterium]